MWKGKRAGHLHAASCGADKIDKRFLGAQTAGSRLVPSESFAAPRFCSWDRVACVALYTDFFASWATAPFWLCLCSTQIGVEPCPARLADGAAMHPALGEEREVPVSEHGRDGSARASFMRCKRRRLHTYGRRQRCIPTAGLCCSDAGHSANVSGNHSSCAPLRTKPSDARTSTPLKSPLQPSRS